MVKVLCVFGTRPEAIKMAPVVKALREATDMECRVCLTGQHRQMLDQVMSLFDLSGDYDLDLMKPNQSLSVLTAGILSGLSGVFGDWRPDIVLVHGDTTTTMATTLAAYYERIPVGHVEAGLRSGDMNNPWPEEFNRRFCDMVTTLAFAPTSLAAENLRAEDMDPASIRITGNTVIDALLYMSAKTEADDALAARMLKEMPFLDSDRKMVLVTGHRRESFGSKFENICHALKALGDREDCLVVYPVHLNPNVREPVNRILGDTRNVHLIEPLDYYKFVWMMNRAYIILTDSGGIQEEAPSLGKPVLVMRDVTERQEAIDAGVARLVGTEIENILHHAELLLNDAGEWKTMAKASNPFGDGTASAQIVSAIREHYGN